MAGSWSDAVLFFSSEVITLFRPMRFVHYPPTATPPAPHSYRVLVLALPFVDLYLKVLFLSYNPILSLLFSDKCALCHSNPPHPSYHNKLLFICLFQNRFCQLLTSPLTMQQFLRGPFLLLFVFILVLLQQFTYFLSSVLLSNCFQLFFNLF
jgi:hypothetical protein